MFKKLVIVIGLLVLTGSAASAIALPTIEITVGGVKFDDIGAVFDPTGEDSWTVHADPFATANFRINLDEAVFNADPFVAYAYGVQNLTSAPLMFTIVFTTPYLGGPYNMLRSTHSDSFTNFIPTVGGGVIDNNVTVTPAAPQTLVHQPFVNGLPVGGINPGGSRFGPFAPFSGNFEPGATVDVPGAYAANGTLSVVTSYTLSAGDLYSLNGIAQLVNVPEPATFALMGCGLVALGFMVRRRR